MTKIAVFVFALFISSVSWACDQETKLSLDQSFSIAKDLPQKDSPDTAEKYGEDWVESSRMIEGGLRYLIHDIAIQYAKSGCWDSSINAVQLIKNPGVFESALSQIAIEFAKNGNFIKAKSLIKSMKLQRSAEIAREEVAIELVKKGKLEEGRDVLRGVGLNENHYQSFFYNHTMNLAKNGFYDEALKFVSKREISDPHVRNARGDMLLLLYKNQKFDMAETIANLYETNKTSNTPDRQLSLYYTKLGRYDKANKYLERITDPSSKAYLFFQLASSAKDASVANAYYEKGKYYIKWRGKKEEDQYWTRISNNADSIARYEGLESVKTFIETTLEPNSTKAGLAHARVAEYLLKNNAPDKVIQYLGSIDHDFPDSKYLRVLAQIRLNELSNIPEQNLIGDNNYKYHHVVFEALKSSIPKDKIKSKIDEQFTNENSFVLKSALFQLIGWATAQHDGIERANELSKSIVDKHLLARWLIGISKHKNNEIFEDKKEPGFFLTN